MAISTAPTTTRKNVAALVPLLRFSVWIVPIAMQVLGAGVVSAQDYPNKPIRIVASEPGGGVDFGARLVAQGLTASLGQPLIVENRASATGPEIAAKALPDGYTLLFIGTNLWVKPFLQKVPYDPVKDFSPITLVARAANILVVTPSLPVKSVKELIALAKARPGELNYASGATGTTAHLTAELFKAMAGVDIVGIPYKGTGPGLIDLISGRVQIMFVSASSVASHIKAGRLRALAVGSAQPSALAPGLPTVAATVPGYEGGSPYAIFAPAGAPLTIINRLNREIVRVINQPDVTEKFLASGSEPVGSSPQELAATIKSEMVKWGKLIKDAGISAN